ncbi:MAG: QueT transporter family protein [Oscillospiraceae bacterium]|nr:QueT transporter family protein [Oscillospiraceae bacterium]
MNKKTRFMARSALIAALYVALTYLQNFLLPGTTSMAIQFRFSEALCVLALFTPSAVPGLTLGCLLFNVSYTHTLPLDFLLGTMATFLAVGGMCLTRRWTIFGYPLFALLLPAITNGILVGWEISMYVGGAFWLNALYVAIGEAVVLLTAGTALFYAIGKRNLGLWLRT